jgi:hyperosmotically inducible periplasmic protein
LKSYLKLFLCLIFSFLMASGSWVGAQGQKPQLGQRSPDDLARSQQRITKEVRHELVMLPYYSVFDNLAYSVDGDTVTLMGQVARPSLKSDAEAAVKSIEAVSKVNNQIEVLPPSPEDDRLRLLLYRAIYGTPPLERYAIQSVPPIHIIVKNGHVTLEGVVSSEADKNLAQLKANGIPGIFSVTNNLRVEKG